MFKVVSKKLVLWGLFLALSMLLSPTLSMAADDVEITDGALNANREMEQLREMDLLLQWMEEFRRYQDDAIVGSVPDTCLSSPLPTSPKTPNYSKTHTYNKETMSMTFWRETCNSGSGKALLMRATPKVGSPFLCSSAFKVIQNGVQHDSIKLQSVPGSMSFCAELFVPTTLIVNEYEFGQEQFDPAKALAIIYGMTDGDRVTREIPDGSAPTPNISGTTDGYKNYNATCTNTTSGAVVKIPLQAGTQGWDCGKAGLAIKSGDKIKVTITGTAK